MAMLSALALPMAAQAQYPVIMLEPAGAWVLQREAEMCRISRDFAANGQTTSLHLRSYGPQGAYEVRAIGPGLLRDDRRARLITAAFGQDAQPTQIMAIASSSGGMPMLTFQARGNRAGNLFLRGRWNGGGGTAGIIVELVGGGLVIEAPGMAQHRFNLGSLEEAQALLDACDAQLLQEWGFDGQVQSTLSRQPNLLNGENVAYWIIYPPNLLINRVSTIVQFRATVTAIGAITDCVIQTANWDRKASRQTCAALGKDARFEPALDASGKPVDALYRGSYMMVMFD